ncbi:MAG: chromosomal replication initiator protein DnaA [Phycisphaerales bacterium]|nr:chromosomal replication initiator protein DnaA [Phycisphaerales bacterium]
MPNADVQAWSEVLKYLRTHHADMTRQWFDEIEPLGIESGVFRLRTTSEVHRRYLERQCANVISSALQTVSGRLLSVRFLGPEERGGTQAAPEQVPASNGAVASQPVVAEGLVLNPDFAFDHFVVGQENRLAFAAAKAVSEEPGRRYNPLFVHGQVGVGKSHLLQAICLTLMQREPTPTMHYISCEAFASQYVSAVGAGRMDDFHRRFRQVDVLVIDDIHFLTKRDRSQEEFFHTFNALHMAGRQIVMSSDAPPQDIPDLEARLVSRFQSGLVVSINAPLYETRIEIVKQKARMLGLDVPNDVAEFIASTISSNVRELQGALYKLQMYHSATQQPVSLSLAREALSDALIEIKPEVTIMRIIDAVVDHYGVKLVDLQSKRRQKSIAHPRQVCMYLVRRHTRHSLEEIGGYFGGRDHTTVMHAVRTIETKRSSDSELDRVLEALERRCGTLQS